jgi:asparagine synthase (glutamine-hydrolysing)
VCGIVGLFGPGVSGIEESLRRMMASIAHRGPDDEGALLDGDFAMGIRRLSIIDLESGRQPIWNETGTLAIVFNGEIYNYLELRECLQLRGHRFRTKSDTEVILHAFEEFGEECVNHLNGMFAFAIWNRVNRTLFMARDRLGVKPLYYAVNGGNFVFASEIKALLASSLVSKRLRQEALWHYLTFRYVPGSMSVWADVAKLPPAHVLTLDTRDMTVRTRRYWDIPSGDGGSDLSDAEEQEQFSALFEDSVRRRLLADVPIGILLSGGLDSSLVAAVVQRLRKSPPETFSVSFRDGGDADESEFARCAAKHVGAMHHEIKIGREEFESWMPEFVRFSDEPLADSAAVPLFFVSKLAAERVKVVLSGEGSDELLAGYDFEFALRDIDRVTRQARAGSRMLGMLPSGFASRFKASVGRYRVGRLFIEPTEVVRWMAPNMTSAFSSLEKRALWPTAPVFEESNELIRRVYDRSPTSDPLNAMLYQYAQDWLVEDLLMKADKMTMAASIELREPFLDYRLVEWLAFRPASSKLRMTAAGVEKKVLLRRYAAPLLPREIIDRPKVGFATPVLQWIREDRGGMVTRALKSSDSWVRSFFDARAVDRLVARAVTSAHAAEQIWHLYVLEHWGRVWM